MVLKKFKIKFLNRKNAINNGYLWLFLKRFSHWKTINFKIVRYRSESFNNWKDFSFNFTATYGQFAIWFQFFSKIWFFFYILFRIIFIPGDLFVFNLFSSLFFKWCIYSIIHKQTLASIITYFKTTNLNRAMPTCTACSTPVIFKFLPSIIAGRSICSMGSKSHFFYSFLIWSLRIKQFWKTAKIDALVFLSTYVG